MCLYKHIHTHLYTHYSLQHPHLRDTISKSVCIAFPNIGFTWFQEADNPKFDTTIQGPWMRKWEMVHMNQHTDSLNNEKLSWHKN